MGGGGGGVWGCMCGWALCGCGCVGVVWWVDTWELCGRVGVVWVGECVLAGGWAVYLLGGWALYACMWPQRKMGKISFCSSDTSAHAGTHIMDASVRHSMHTHHM